MLRNNPEGKSRKFPEYKPLLEVLRNKGLIEINFGANKLKIEKEEKDKKYYVINWYKYTDPEKNKEKEKLSLIKFLDLENSPTEEEQRFIIEVDNLKNFFQTIKGLQEEKENLIYFILEAFNEISAYFEYNDIIKSHLRVIVNLIENYGVLPEDKINDIKKEFKINEEENR